MTDEYDNEYNNIINFRNKEDYSPEFQIRLLMFNINEMFARPKLTLKSMVQLNNMLRLFGVLLCVPHKYTSFKFEKFSEDIDNLNYEFMEHAFFNYTCLIDIAKDKGMWGTENITEVI